MRLLWSFLVSICTLTSNGQTIFNPQIISSTQNEYLGLHAIDPLGNTYLNVFKDGNTAISIYGKNYNLNAGNYIFRFDATESLTLIYNASNLGDVQALTADKDGNIYVASVTGSQHNHFRYTKLDSSGTILWQVQGYASEIIPNQILIDEQGSSYIAGTVIGPSFFGVQLVKYTCCNPKEFLLKISSTGSLTWIKTSAVSDKSSSLDVIRFDKHGNIILGGSFHTSIKMGTFSLTNPIGDNYSNMYMACISPAGDVLWLKGFSGEGYFLMNDFEIDEEGNYYFTGGFYGTTTYGNVTVSSLSVGTFDLIIGKLSSNFDVEWIKFKETYKSVANYRSVGGDLVITSNGVLVSGVAYSGFQIDNNEFLPASTNLQAIVASISADGSVSWLKGFGDALYPGSYEGASHYFNAGYQFSKISDQCYFISGNFVNTLNTNNGLIQAQVRDAFTGIFSEISIPPPIDLGPDILVDLCEESQFALKLNSTLGNNQFLAVQGVLPTITFLNDSVTQISNIAYGITKFKWVVLNCGIPTSKLITINRIAQPNGPQVPNPIKYCTSQLSDAVITLSGDNVVWFSDPSLSNQIARGNSLVPTISDTLYVTSVENGCVSKLVQIVISIIDNPSPPVTQSFSVCRTHDLNLTAVGQDLAWYDGVKSELPVQVGSAYNVNYANSGTYEVYVSQTIEGCESTKAKVEILVNEIPPPVTSTFETCVGIPIGLTAIGENLQWYDRGTSAIAFGNSYEKEFSAIGIYEIGVSQIVNECESEKATITINVKQFSLDDIFISNVITPNGDHLNEEFYLIPFPNEDCIGEFKSIKIMNRWGGPVFYETHRNFRWGGEDIVGVYYYIISFEKESFKGLLTVLK